MVALVVAACSTSVASLSWSRIPDNESVFGGEGEQAMFDVAAGGPGLVAVGWDDLLGDIDAA